MYIKLCQTTHASEAKSPWIEGNAIDLSGVIRRPKTFQLTNNVVPFKAFSVPR